MIAQATIEALFVAWQQPDTRRYYPVARLVFGIGERHNLFEFAYIRGGEDAQKEGFQPFLAFPHLDRVYRSDALFPFFTNRLMSRNRPDFPSYMQRLALPLDAPPMTILARSGGTRATDSIEMFPLPVFNEAICCYQNYFWMHGFRHLKPQQQSRVLALNVGEALTPVPEPSNAHDPDAVQLFTADGVHVGYIPRYLASDAVHLHQHCTYFRVFVGQVNAESAPVQQRLLCRVESCWPDGFLPCNLPDYQPVSTQATVLDPCGTTAT